MSAGFLHDLSQGSFLPAKDRRGAVELLVFEASQPLRDGGTIRSERVESLQLSDYGVIASMLLVASVDYLYRDPRPRHSFHIKHPADTR